MGKMVTDLEVVTWAFFAKGYDRNKNHLGADYRIGKGEELCCHFDGEVIYVGGQTPDTYATIWDGLFLHVFGHLKFSAKIGPIKKGQLIGLIIDYPTGVHLHYGMNMNRYLPLGDGWGWGKCPISKTRTDEAAKGWVDPVLNVFSRQLALGVQKVPIVINR